MMFSSVPGTLQTDKVGSTTEGPAPAMPAHACLTHPTLNKGAGSGPWINGLCIKKLGAKLYREQRQIHCHIEQYSPQQPIVAWNHLMRQHRGYTVPHCNTEQYPPLPQNHRSLEPLTETTQSTQTALSASSRPLPRPGADQ